jgi:hypothetical protein
VRLLDAYRHEPWHVRSVEAAVLGYFILWPYESEWHLAELSPDLFSTVPYAKITEIVCGLRDRGRRIHWRRIRWMARQRDRELATHIKNLKEHAAIGRFDVWFGELRFLASNRVAKPIPPRRVKSGDRNASHRNR